jgi:hypothetical protein
MVKCNPCSKLEKLIQNVEYLKVILINTYSFNVAELGDYGFSCGKCIDIQNIVNIRDIGFSAGLPSEGLEALTKVVEALRKSIFLSGPDGGS